MREIKYRGLNEETGKWVYGWYTKLVEGIRRFDAIISDVDGELTRFYIHNKETIEQFTGLRDKNGKGIFEGDRVRVLYTDWPSKTDDTKTLDEYLDSISHVGIIEYSNEYGEAGFRVLFDNGFVGMLNVGAHGRITVIGNIHENPELRHG